MFSWLKNFDWSSLPLNKPRIVLAHGGVHDFGGRDYLIDEEAPQGANNLIDLDCLPINQIDYIALGDWHNLKKVNEKVRNLVQAKILLPILRKSTSPVFILI